MPLLQVAEAEVRFGGVHALRGVDLTVEAGNVTGLIGPNGAGKTTCFNAICGLQTLSAGRITFDGTDMTGLKPHKRARLGIARTFQRLEVFGSLSVRENVLAAAEIRRRWSHDRSNAAAQRRRGPRPGRADEPGQPGGRHAAHGPGPPARAGPLPGHAAAPPAPRRALLRV